MDSSRGGGVALAFLGSIFVESGCVTERIVVREIHCPCNRIVEPLGAKGEDTSGVVLEVPESGDGVCMCKSCAEPAPEVEVPRRKVDVSLPICYLDEGCADVEDDGPCINRIQKEWMSSVEQSVWEYFFDGKDGVAVVNAGYRVFLVNGQLVGDFSKLSERWISLGCYPLKDDSRYRECVRFMPSWIKAVRSGTAMAIMEDSNFKRVCQRYVP